MPAPLPLHSFHAFLFPFEWKPRVWDGLLLEEQTDLKRICSVMDAATANWRRMSAWTHPQSLAQYNEANYFYDFVRPVLYGDDQAKYQVYYQHREARGSEYIINLENGEQFRLELDAVGLSFYNTGVGILSFHCYNRAHPSPDEVLKINQYGRRLFPPFLGTDPEKTGTQEFFEDNDWRTGLERVKKSELAQSIVLEKNNRAWAAEDFDKWASGAPNLEHTPGLLRQLLPSVLLSSLDISPVLDDRMFVVCWYGNDELAGKIRSWDESGERDWWYKYVFVDTRWMSSQSEELTQKQLAEHSNTRWLNYGTFYGVSRYSFVCLTSSLETLLQPGIDAAFLVSHVQTHYFKLAELALLQRGCVLRFSDEVTAISDLPEKNRALGAHVSSLYKQYIRFVNKIYFREVTAQEQGIELYDLLQKHMRLENQVKDLDKEIEELHGYVMLLEEERRNRQLEILTYIGAFFVMPTFLMSYLGINAFEADKFIYLTVGDILTCLFSSLFIGILMLAGLRQTGILRWIFLLTALVAVIFFMLFVPHWLFKTY